MRTYIPSVKLGLASAITIAAMGMTACGGSSNNSSDKPTADFSVVNKTITETIAKALICEPSSDQGKRVICLGKDGLSDDQVQTDLIDAISAAESGDTIILPKGSYKFNQTINMTGKNVLGEKVDNITIKGAGMSQTIIDFSAANGDGILLEGSKTSPNKNYVFEDFGVYEAGNNAIKVKGIDGITFRRIATVWQNDFQKTNGAYGLYPVETSNVLIEDCYVRGSADAGVYVGQSDNIIIRRTHAEKNVAGIEIENSTRADAYDNVAIGNTGGLLVFDLPIGNGKYGSGVRLFKNTVTKNNAANFANTGSFEGGVHIVPPGTGVIILSTSNVEIFDNTITDHSSMSVALSSYLLPAGDDLTATPKGDVSKFKDISKFASKFLDGWNPLVRGINIHGNTITNADGIYNPSGSLIKDLIAGYKAADKKMPDIIYDGIGQLLSHKGLEGTVSAEELAAVKALYSDPAILQGLYAATLSAAQKVAQKNEDAANTPRLLAAGLQAAVGHGVGFGPLKAAEGVCASNNGASTTQGGVYRVDPSKADAFNQAGPAPIFSEPSNDAMNCGEGTAFTTPYVGKAVMLTINGNHYGCGSAEIEGITVKGDDADKAICVAK